MKSASGVIATYLGKIAWVHLVVRLQRKAMPSFSISVAVAI
ncbi:hypothetical protein X566_23205 [Afipia sp. P52-10]|nr:hypothetical protein X566_23205 [Afipia sp. P52-10]